VKARAAARRWTRTERALLLLVPPLAAAAIRLLGATLRYESIYESADLAERLPPPPTRTIGCFWHQCVIPAAHYFRRYHPVIVISRSFDGELVTRVLARLGHGAVRGSSSSGGAASLLALRAVLERGGSAVFTADGPRGPVYRAKPGAVKLAGLTGDPLRCFHMLPARAWQLRSWDRFLIPKPFSRVIVSWAALVPVPADPDATQLERKRRELERALERARLRAYAHLNRVPDMPAEADTNAHADLDPGPGSPIRETDSKDAAASASPPRAPGAQGAEP
jgi:lysophospholipid acyltransferase (LPLAT)-like uncharacterized protein